MNKTKIFGLVLVILLGIFLVVFGGFDDSPVAQLLGLIIVIAGFVGLVKNRKRKF